MFDRLLIANRGEIACRVVRTARRMGVSTVAVFTDPDRQAQHVRTADEAVSVESYLDIAAIVAAAKRSGAQAIHPGYGFLSENAEFAEACAEAGITFVGPSSGAIRTMGDKAAAKAKMIDAGVPVVPGYSGEDQTEAVLTAEAAAIGFPVLIKAAAGGGGRGMRRVDAPEEFAEALASARREASSAFGNDDVLLEKLVTEARHVEVQVFGDRHGNIVHLFERDCSAQRRHQKIIEESPSPSVDAALRERLGAWAVAAAASVDYEGAGTVEFIIDGEGEAYFLEMNTRLQVEHPVTEMVTGIDLVEWQLRAASGEKLPLTQDEIGMKGHAIEARLYAEDPYQGFLPQTGNIESFESDTAEASSGLRIDAGFVAGDTVTPHFDPMLAKFVAHGSNRDEAITRLTRLIADTPLMGVANNGGFLIRLLRTAEFGAGDLTTGTIDAWIDEAAAIVQAPQPEAREFVIAASVAALAPGGNWFRSTGVAQCPLPLVCVGLEETVLLGFERGRLVSAQARDETFDLNRVTWDGGRLAMEIDGLESRHRVHVAGTTYHLMRDGEVLVFTEPNPLAATEAAADPRRVVSPASGSLVRVAVSVGDRVEDGTAVAIVEAMKMETTLVSGAAGTVAVIHAQEKDQVRAGDLIVEIEPEEQA